MIVDWAAMQKAIYPIPSYEELSRQCREVMKYPFFHQCFNYSMREMADYTRRLLGEDIRNRYADWCQALVGTCHRLEQAQVRDIVELLEQVNTREKFEGFIARSEVDACEVVELLKYLFYWFIPRKKGLKELMRKDPRLFAVIDLLRGSGIRSNLDVLENGRTPELRKRLAEGCGAEQAALDELVNRADFSRMPWASAATISNIVGAGYGSIEKLASADLERVEEDFYRYGESIGKNLRFGNEINSSHRIAKLVPRVLIG